MLLNRVKIENFRGFRRINVTFEPTTVVIGENNYGKTSLLDALWICLGNHAAESGAFPFRPTDFRLDPEKGAADDPIKITVVLREPKPAGGKPYRGTSLEKALTRIGRNRKQLVLRVIATPGPEPQVEWFFSDAHGKPLGEKNDPAQLADLRRHNPFLHIREDPFHPDTAPDLMASQAPGKDERRSLEQQIERSYRALTTSRAPIPQEQLALGMEAAERLLDGAAKRFRVQVENARRQLDAVVQTPIPLAVGDKPGENPGAGMQALGRLLLYGAVLEARGDEAIARDARPILGLEEPEAHQHPRMLASLWAVLDEFPGQKIVTTNSSELLAAVPLKSVRRLMRRKGSIEVFRPGNRLTTDEVRRIGYHIRVRRGGALFQRLWVLIEGETEFWLLPEFARLCGYEFPTEGIGFVEFAQAGVEPLIKLARGLGVEWHLLSDGDTAGQRYMEDARPLLGRDRERDRLTILEHPDLEQCLWHHGYADVYRELAGAKPPPDGHTRKRDRPDAVIDRAVRLHSKPYLALAVVEAAAKPGSPGVPPVLEKMIERVVRMARSCVV